MGVGFMVIKLGQFLNIALLSFLKKYVSYVANEPKFYIILNSSVGDHGDTTRIDAYHKPEKTMDVFS